jgi:hypothetical protein
MLQNLLVHSSPLIWFEKSNYSSCRGRNSEDICSSSAVQALRNKETQDETQFTTKIGGKTSLGLSYMSFCKILIPSYEFDALLCRNWSFSPPDRLTLRITLMNLGLTPRNMPWVTDSSRQPTTRFAKPSIACQNSVLDSLIS